MPHEFLKILRLKIIGNTKESRKCRNIMKLIVRARSVFPNEIFVTPSKILLKTAIELLLW